MTINGISGSPAPVPQRVLTENIAPAMAQAFGPQDTLGIKTQREPSKGLSPSTRLADLKPDQLSSLGGGSALSTIAESQPNTTVGEVGPLLRSEGALDSIANLMSQRRDLKVGDFVSQDQKGRVRIDPSYKDEKTTELLKERTDLTPSEITAMRQNFTKDLKSPSMGKQATEKAFELMKKRTDLKPEDMNKMMGSMRTAVGGDKKAGQGGGGGDDQASAQAALDMFDSASKLMTKRTDLSPERMGEMAQSVGQLSSPEDKQGPQNIAESFDAANKSLEKNALRKPEEMSKMASTMGEHFKGGDEKTASHRMNAFKKGSEMMGDNTSVDHNSINKMLTQATERDPKLKNGEGEKKAQRLGKVMDDVANGVKSGTVSANDLSSHFRNQDAEKARFAKTDPKKEEAKKKEDGQPKTEQAKGEDNKPKSAETEKPGASKPGESVKPTETSNTAEPGKPSGEKQVLASFQTEEQGAQPPGDAGAAPNVDAKTVANLGPGQAAGTASAGVAPGTASKTGAGPGASGPSPTANSVTPQVQPKGPTKS